MRRFLLITAFFAIAGCATPGQEPDQPEYLQALESGGLESVSNESKAPENYNGIEDIEAPNVAETPVAMLPPVAESDIVCTREAATGSILKTKVCRRRSDIELQSQKDQRELRRIKTEIAVGSSRPGVGPGRF
jgi:hypothetical protein